MSKVGGLKSVIGSRQGLIYVPVGMLVWRYLRNDMTNEGIRK